jgi:hypothetical protein
VERKKILLAGRSKYYLRLRAHATYNTIKIVIGRLKKRWIQEEVGIHYGGEREENWAHAIACSLFDEGLIDDIKEYQERIMEAVEPWQGTDYAKMLDDAEKLHSKIIGMINSGETDDMSDEELQELIHGYNGIIDALPYVSSSGGGGCGCSSC